MQLDNKLSFKDSYSQYGLSCTQYNNPQRCTSFVALGTWLHLYGDNVLTAKEQTKTNNNSRHPLIRNWSQRELCPSSGTKIYGCICSPRTRHHSGIVNHENVTMCVQGSQSVVEEHTPKRPPPHSSWDNSYQRNIRLIKYPRDMEGDLVDKGQGTRMEHMGIKVLWVIPRKSFRKGFGTQGRK